MRRIVLFVGAVLLLGTAVILMRQGGAIGRAGAGAGPDAAAGPDPEDAGAAVLERLREEISRAAPVERRTDGARLAAARAWVGANRPADWPYAEYEAFCLAGFESNLLGVPRTIAEILDSERVGDMLPGDLNTDDDGRVSDSELGAFAAFVAQLNQEKHPYLRRLMDADADGSFSADERARASQLTINELVWRHPVERAKLREWDSDGDGSLSAAERAAGDAELRSRVEIHADGHVDWSDEPGTQSEAEQERMLGRIAAERGEPWADAARSRRDDALGQMLVRPFIEASMVEPIFDIAAEVRTEPLPQPDPSDFGADSDGGLDEQELAAFMEAMELWETASRDQNALRGASMQRALFERAGASYDTDGDRRMSADEWSRRAAEFAETRRARLFLLEYDLDASGRVEPRELDTFLAWYRAGSPRADANFDGRVDPLDLGTMAAGFERQGG